MSINPYFTKQVRSEISARLKAANAKGHKDIFNAINEGADVATVEAMIEQAIAEAAAQVKQELPRTEQGPVFNVWGQSLIAANALSDMAAVMRLPNVVGGALMPDGHRVLENHVPVGGVLLTEGAIYPAVVGSDISCSVLLTVTDMSVNDNWLTRSIPSMDYVLRNYAYFGQELNPNNNAIYEFVDLVAWGREVLAQMETDLGVRVANNVLGTAVTQFGTSGDGNHFIEFGVVNVKNDGYGFYQDGQDYLAVLSHFGSRSVGSTIAKAFEQAAAEQFVMPKGIGEAPLFEGTPLAHDYVLLMQWAGMFAECGHRWLHTQVIDQLAERVPVGFSNSETVYSRHNYAWLTDEGWLHRKGATPAAYGEYGMIPATMGDASQIVMGLGNQASYNSASHGAGRTHSRGQALQAFKGDTAAFVQHEYGVTLIGGDADEDPRAYKRIKDVMAAQADCVQVLGEFTPKVVRMANPRMSFRRGR